MTFKDVQVKKSKIGQFKDGLGVFANRDFKKDEIVIKWNLKKLAQEEYKSGMYLIRPDGYIGLRHNGLDEEVITPYVKNL